MFKKMFKRGLQVCCVTILVFAFTMLPVTGDVPQVEAGSSPFLKRVDTVNRYALGPGNTFLNLTVLVYKVMEDGCSTYDWYLYRVDHEMVPCDTWHNDHAWSCHYVWMPGNWRWLEQHSPGTTEGVTTITVSLQGGNGGATAGLSWSYAISDVVVMNDSNRALHEAKWQHAINEHAFVGRHTFNAMPGFTVRTAEVARSLVDATYKSRWREDTWWFPDCQYVIIPLILLDVIYPPPLVVRIAGSCTVKKIVEASEIPFEASRLPTKEGVWDKLQIRKLLKPRCSAWSS